MATMAEGSISTSYLPTYVLDGLFYSFGEKTDYNDYVRNYHDVGELSNETDRDSGIIFDQYSDPSDDISYKINQKEDLIK